MLTVPSGITRLKRIILAPTLGPSETILAALMLAYGLGLLLPGNEYSRYHNLGILASSTIEVSFSWALITLGTWRLIAIFSNFYRQRIWTTLAATGLWLYLTLSFLLAFPVNQRVFVFAVISLSEAWTLFRIQRKE